MPTNNKDYMKAYRQANKAKLTAQRRARYKGHEAEEQDYMKAYRQANKEKILAKNKAWREANKEKLLAKRKAWREANKEKLQEEARAYRAANKEKLSRAKMAYAKKRFASDPQFRLSQLLRTRVGKAIKRSQRGGSAVRDLGCTIPELITYLESKFLPGMTWENWSSKGWHIDHIIPLASFDLSSPEEFKKACHYTNLQPLWARDNLSKQDKILE